MRTACPLAVLMLSAGAALAQTGSLMSTPPPAPPAGDTGPEVSQDLRAASLLVVEEPKPKQFALHDKVTIIISETSRQSSQQKLDATKETDVKATLHEFPDPAKLLEGELTNGDSSPIASVGLTSKNEFDGDGKYERSDRFTDRLTATVIDVKPNGVLVLEARRTIAKDKEVQILVLTGECRSDDVTLQNTVLSNQLADLTIAVQNEGDVKDTASKGWITRLFDSIFGF